MEILAWCQPCLYHEFKSSFDNEVCIYFQASHIEHWGNSLHREHMTEGCLSQSFPKCQCSLGPGAEYSCCRKDGCGPAEHLSVSMDLGLSLSLYTDVLQQLCYKPPEPYYKCPLTFKDELLYFATPSIVGISNCVLIKWFINYDMACDNIY